MKVPKMNSSLLIVFVTLLSSFSSTLTWARSMKRACYVAVQTEGNILVADKDPKASAVKISNFRFTYKKNDDIVGTYTFQALNEKHEKLPTEVTIAVLDKSTGGCEILPQ